MNGQFSFRTVRKKIIIVSKLAGIVLMVSYLISTRLPLEEEVSFLLWVIFVVLLIIITDYLLGRFISAPICKICEMAHRAARLDFSMPCTITSKDEFGELADNLNKMSENLQETLEKLEKANIRLEKDVRQERKLLGERKELTDRLSHEMKTPIGVIRAYAEGIQDETDERKRQKYSEIIISETERMGMLIETLLDLSALENGAVSLMPERFDFVEFVETVAGRLLIDMPEIDFELQYELPEHKVFVYTDKQRMEQVLDNLIVNGKKNVSPKGILRLSLIEQDNMLHFSVYNQGASIPPEKLPKIWDKFYRDKNAKYNGSGLGLAIVAQILSMQDLEYGAENLSEGVRFFFAIPTIK
jgi:signal transduction histidine kinase